MMYHAIFALMLAILFLLLHFLDQEDAEDDTPRP